MAYRFQVKIASRGFHVYKETTWKGIKVGDEVEVVIEKSKLSKEIDPYCCAFKIQNPFFTVLETVGHIPREISRHVHFFLLTEGGKVSGKVSSIQYRPSPIPAGGLEIPVLLTFSSDSVSAITKMKKFMTELYNYDSEPKYTNEVEEQDEDVSSVFIETEEIEKAEEIESKEVKDDEKTKNIIDIDFDIDMDIAVEKKKNE